jgi:hypothetical protein
MRHRGNSPIVIIIVILVIGAIVAAYYLGKKNIPVTNEDVTASPSLTTSTPNATNSLSPEPQPSTTTYNYTGWQTYSDSKAGFSIQYSPQYKLNTKEEGKNVNFLFCGSGNCVSGFSIGLHTDYNGGSRREWLNSKVDLSTYDVTYEDYNVAGVNALIVKASDPGSMGTTYVVIPKGNKVYLYSESSGQESTSGTKTIISTFKFL